MRDLPRVTQCYSVCPLTDKDKRLMEAAWWERLTVGETGSCSEGWGHTQLIYNPIFCWWTGLCSFPVVWLETNYGGGNKVMVTSYKKSCARTATLSSSDPEAGHRWPMPLPETPGHSQASLCQSLGGHCTFVLGPGAHKVLFVPSKTLFPQDSAGSVIKSHWPPKSNSLRVLHPFARSPDWEIYCGS